jgi:hypothetical protein
MSSGSKLRFGLRTSMEVALSIEVETKYKWHPGSFRTGKCLCAACTPITQSSISC